MTSGTSPRARARALSRGLSRGLSIVPALILLLGAGPLGAQSDPDARLAELGKRQAQIRTVSARFVQRRTMALFAEELVSSGRFAFKHPDRIRWDIEAPQAMTMLITPEGIVTMSPGAAPARMATLPVSAREIAELITGSLDTARHMFDIQSVPGTTGATFALRPRSPRVAATIRGITLDLSPDLGFVRRIVLDEATGDRIEITFHDVELNRDIDDERFTIGVAPAG
jgi:outer membrane lipoprotein-sorting protein